MAKLKELVKKEANHVVVKPPVSPTEGKERTKQYDILTPKQFGTLFKNTLFAPVC